MNPGELGRGGSDGDPPEPTIGDDVTADAVHGTNDQRSHRGLHGGEHRDHPRGRQTEPHVCPREREHQEETRQHETKPREQAPDAAARQRAEVHAQLVRFGAR
jgi:hypothetical protein